MNIKISKILEVVGSGIGGVVLTLVVQQCFPSQQIINLTVNGESVKITEEDYSELYNLNNDLKKELSDTSQELSNVKNELEQKENELSNLQNDLSTAESELNALSKDMPKLEYSDLKINIDGVNKENFIKGYLDIDGRQFVLYDTLNQIVNNDINLQNNTLFIGHSTAEKVNLMDVCAPYDTDGSGGYDTTPFKMGGNQYNGFTMANNGTRYVLINLKNQYSNLGFDFGHVDKSGNKKCTLNIYLDNNLAYSIEKYPDSDISSEIIPLNYAGLLKIEFVAPGINGSYGLGNIWLQY